MPRHTTRYTCLSIAIGYFIISFIWVMFSGRILAAVLNNPQYDSTSANLNELLFISISTGMLYWLLRYWAIAVDESRGSLYKANRSLRSFSDCTKAIGRIDDELQLMKEVCRICVEVGGHRMAWIAKGLDNPGKELCSVAHWGPGDCFLNELQASWADTEKGQGPAGTSLRTREIVVFQDLLNDPRYLPWRKSAQNCGYGSCVALPLLSDSDLYGSLVIFDAKAGAFDEDEIELLQELAGDLSFGLRSIRIKTARLREVDERLMLATIMDQTSDGVITFDNDNKIQYVNPSFESLCGVPAEEAIGVSIHDFECSKRNRAFYQAILGVFDSNQTGGGHFVNKSRDGSDYDIDARISPVFGDNGDVIRYVATIRDVTQETALQRQLRQAQKMEALATLSGGVAHDFNNILAIIITNIEMAREDLPPESPLHHELELVLKAGLRGKTLVKQFLTISRRGDQPQQPVELISIIEECLNMIRATLPTTIEIRRQIELGEGIIAADPSQIHQVMMNLFTNAGDAMREEGGVLSVSVKQTELTSHPDRLHPQLKPGHYLQVDVSDSGHGMSRTVMERIFDPFFTTKGQSRGTGLGLSIAHGIINTHGGTILVQSQPDTGTTFTVLLPEISKNSEQPHNAAPPANERGQGRILFVDDEQDYVVGMKKALEKLGYQVRALTDAKETLALFRHDPAAFDLLITDQNMPQLSGVALTKEILQLRPHLPVILCSGSSPGSDSAVSPARATAMGIARVLMKPVDRMELHQQIQQLLKTE